MTTETPDYAHATPGRTFSTLAYTLLARDNWPVYVNTSRNYAVYNRTDSPTDPGGTVHGGAHLRPVAEYHPLAPDTHHNTGDRWNQAACYLDDRVKPEMTTPYRGPGTEMNEGFVYDEYFVMVESPTGGNIATYGDYSGSTWAASNYRSLLRDYPDTFVEVSYAHGGQALAIPLFVSNEHDDYDTPHYDRDRAEVVADVLAGLAYDYPIYDEGDHSEYEEELIAEALDDNWLSGQIRQDVAAALAALLIERSGTPKQAVDHYDLVNGLEDYLGEVATVRDPYQAEPGPGCHTVYSLFVQFAVENSRIIFESAVEPTFTGMDETADEVARHILEDGGTDVPTTIPVLTPRGE